MENTNNAKHGNDHKKITPSSKGDDGKKDDKKYTSYHTEQPDTSSPQKVKENTSADGMQKKMKQSE